MNIAHIHLMLNHIPVLGIVFGLVIGVVGLFARSKGVIRVGLGIITFSAIVAVPVYLTGDPAEEMVEGLPGVSEGVIGQHESAAAFSLVLAGVSGLLAAISLLFWRSLTSKLPGYFVAGTLLAALLTTGSMIWTANLGGQIRHTEIRTTTEPTTGNAGTADRKGEKTKDDDD